MFKFVSLFSLTSVLACGLVGLLTSHKENVKVNAAETQTYPRNGQSGTVMFVNGKSTYFNTGEANLAIYCFNSDTDNAWSESYSYRVSGDLIRAMIPYQNGNAKTWSNFIICRYNPDLDPRESGWGGVYNQTKNLSFSSFMYAQNTIEISGYKDKELLVNDVKASYTYYGISNSQNQYMYLDLSGFTDWEIAGAKFGIWFFNPSSGNANMWGESNSSEGRHYSLCWKVEGQDNPHLYECLVPGNGTIWNSVQAVRFDSVVDAPDWDHEWNKTQVLTFNSSNQTKNMIRVNDWGEGQIDTNVISRESRVDFYGRYFMNTVSCSGDGSSDITTSEMWEKVKYEYVNHLSTAYQGDVWTTVADKSTEASQVAQAMARYDYIVLYKKYSHEDFINRKDSPNATQYANAYTFDNIGESSDMMIIVASILSASVLSMTLLIILKKKKHK